MLTFGFNCGAHAMWKTIGRFWEDVKRETTNAAHNTEKAIAIAWEDTKREATVFAHFDAGKVVIKSAVSGAVATSRLSSGQRTRLKNLWGRLNENIEK
jgi:O-succinylbenzoate synthase